MTACPKLLRHALALACAVCALQANEAPVVFQCYSVRLHPATATHLGVEYRLEATTATDGTINDEIGVAEEGAFLHGTTLVFNDPAYAFPLTVACGVEVPDPADSNWNGISDFFEVDRAVTDLPSVGEFELDDGVNVHPGTLDMVWNRAAGAAIGTCRLRFRIDDAGLDLTFEHPFEVYDYRGTLTYAVQGTNVTALASLTRQGAPGSLSGAIEFLRVDWNELEYDAFGCTNAFGRAVGFYSSFDTEISLLRGGLLTNYYTILYTEDGWPDTDTDEEYEIWQFHIFDPNDADRDRIPDLSDDPVAPPPPRLGIRITDKTVYLEIEAAAGKEATLQQAAGIGWPAWTPVRNFTLTNAVHTLELAAPAVPAFWRVSVE